MIFFHSWTNFLLQWCSSTSDYDTQETCKSGIWFLAKWSSLMGIAFYRWECLRSCEINCRFTSNSFTSSILKTSVIFARGLCFGWQSDCTIKTSQSNSCEINYRNDRKRHGGLHQQESFVLKRGFSGFSYCHNFTMGWFSWNSKSLRVVVTAMSFVLPLTGLWKEGLADVCKHDEFCVPLAFQPGGFRYRQLAQHPWTADLDKPCDRWTDSILRAGVPVWDLSSAHWLTRCKSREPGLEGGVREM